jgi:hypothetical protein
MFLDCPAYLEPGSAARCGLPAEVRCRFIMRSTDGPLESAMIRCPAGHWFNGLVESLACERGDKDDPGPAAGATGAGFPAQPRREVPRPSTAPAYYLGRPARLWISAMRPRRSRPILDTSRVTLRAAEPDGWAYHPALTGTRGQPPRSGRGDRRQ